MAAGLAPGPCRMSGRSELPREGPFDQGVFLISPEQPGRDDEPAREGEMAPGPAGRGSVEA